jgi:hypothetical protein
LLEETKEICKRELGPDLGFANEAKTFPTAWTVFTTAVAALSAVFATAVTALLAPFATFFMVPLIEKLNRT